MPEGTILQSAEVGRVLYRLAQGEVDFARAEVVVEAGPQVEPPQPRPPPPPDAWIP